MYLNPRHQRGRKYLDFESRSQAQPEMVTDWPPEKESTHAVSFICAVVHMVLVDSVWLPTPYAAGAGRGMLLSMEMC